MTPNKLSKVKDHESPDLMHNRSSVVIEKDSVSSKPHCRAASWWLTWEDLEWPNPSVLEKIQRRADEFAGANIRQAVIFGAHFRWDYLPIWNRLHDLLATINSELSARGILLFDHHSSVLTHRPRNAQQAEKIWKHQRHHLPFYPSIEAASTWEYEGSRLDSWRMESVVDGEPILLDPYVAEQFCFNNADFRKAYFSYVNRMLRETGITALMSDDAIYYSGWTSCGCHHCRAAFRHRCGRELPPTDDLGFWGNMDSEAFHQWIEFRFESAAKFLAELKASLPTNCQLMTCCSDSVSQALVGPALSYQRFAPFTDYVMLEMCHDVDDRGCWSDPVAKQLLHLAIGEEHHQPAIGLCYAFFPSSAFFLWAMNKFLGSGTWLSTLKGRLSNPADEVAALPSEPQIAALPFGYEAANPHLFEAQLSRPVVVYFSQSTRNHYAQIREDYVDDFEMCCRLLLEAGVSFQVATNLEQLEISQLLVAPGVACLSVPDRRCLSDYLAAGGRAILTGVSAHYDEMGKPTESFLQTLAGISVRVSVANRNGSFPPGIGINPLPRGECEIFEQTSHSADVCWHQREIGLGCLDYHPDALSINAEVGPSIVAEAQAFAERVEPIFEWLERPQGWLARSHRDGNRVMIHFLPECVANEKHPALYNAFYRQGITSSVVSRTEGHVKLRSKAVPLTVNLHFPERESVVNLRTVQAPGFDFYEFLIEPPTVYAVLEFVFPDPETSPHPR